MLSPPAVATRKSGFGSLVMLRLSSDAVGKVVTWVGLVESGPSGALWVGVSADDVVLVVSGDDDGSLMGELRLVKEGSGPN